MSNPLQNSHTEKADDSAKAEPAQEENKQTSMRRGYFSMSNFIVIAFLTVGAILVGIGINYHTKGGYESIKMASLWGIIGYVFLGVGFYFAYYEYVVKPARAVTRRTERTRPAFHEKSEWYTVQFGLDTARNKIADLEKAPFTPFVFGEIVPLRIYAENGVVFADVTLYQGSDKPTVIIKHSEYDKDLPAGWDLNAKDGEALEIVNETGIPVFQLIYKSPVSIEVQGVFATGKGFLIADHSGIIGGANDIPRALKPIFKYPAWQHRGEYVDPADRTWLAVNVIPAGPLVFRGNNMELKVRFIVSNTGRFPANGVVVNAGLLFPKPPDMIEKGLWYQRNVCRRTGIEQGIAVFPNDPKAIDMLFTTEMALLEAQSEKLKGGIAMPLLVGCVNYLVGDTNHQTGFFYDILTRDAQGQVFRIHLGRDVPLERLRFEKSSLGGDYAN